MEKLIATALAVLDGSTDTDAASNQADKAWDWLTNDYDDRAEELGDQELCAMGAAVEALLVALGTERFGRSINRYMTDAELDPFSTDSAAWAAAALAGPVWDRDSSDDKRKEFWEWWLSEAIEMAYQRCGAIR